MMNTNLQAVVEQHGPWTAMAIKLPGGIYTREPAVDYRLKRLLQVAADCVKKPFTECRVLDLACLEGHYGIEFALHGATVVGIEGRAASVAKCEFAARELNLERAQFFQDDVRNLSVEKYGRFDIVICSGLLYHLPARDAWRLLQSMHAVCTGLLIIDTFIALASQRTVDINGATCHGHIYNEHEEGDSAEEKAKKLWASLDNNASFWFTEPSLINMLSKLGFTSTLDVITPHMPGMLRDRKTYIAIKGKPVEILSSDETANAARTDIPEGFNARCDSSQIPRGKVFVTAKRLLPQPVKNAIKPALRAIGVLPPDGTPWFQREKNKR